MGPRSPPPAGGGQPIARGRQITREIAGARQRAVLSASHPPALGHQHPPAFREREGIVARAAFRQERGIVQEDVQLASVGERHERTACNGVDMLKRPQDPNLLSQGRVAG